MTDMNQPAQQLAQAKTGKLRQWPWIAALIVALAAGFAIGTAGKDVRNDRQAEQLAEQTATAEDRETAAVQRETEAVQKRDSLASRAASLDTRQAELDRISADLAKREQAVLPKEQAAAKSRITRDGIYLVGKDIAPATYRTTGSSSCYWQRSSGTSGDFGEILANGNESGQAIVTIAPSDIAFTTKRCGAWQLVN